MPVVPPLEGPTGVKLLQPSEGKDAILEASDPGTDNWPLH